MRLLQSSSTGNNWRAQKFDKKLDQTWCTNFHNFDFQTQWEQ